MQRYTCPECDQGGAHPKALPPPLCHVCGYAVEMQKSVNQPKKGRIMEKIETLGPGLSDTGLDAPNPPPAGYRTVNLHLSNEDYVRIGIPTAPSYGPTPGHQELYRAIGYLSSWNLNYPVVDINVDGEFGLMAVYRHAGGEVGYVIGAVWNEAHGKYGFHS